MGAIWILTKAIMKVVCVIVAMPLIAMGVFSLLWGNLLPAVVCGGGAVVLLALGLFVIRVRRA